MAQKFIDLDAIVPENEVVVKLFGAEHKLAPITVDDFVENTRALEDYGKRNAPTFEDELNLVIGALIRAFPTMTPDILRKLTLAQLQALQEFANEQNGTKKVEQDIAKEGAENPPVAGQ